MNNRRRQILSLLVVFLATEATYADMMSASWLNSEGKPPQYVSDKKELRHTTLPDMYDRLFFSDSNFATIQFLPKTPPDFGHPSEVPYAIELTDGPDSYHLCLYALFGLSLCSAPHWIRRLSIGHIPDWYHNGGPFQIGHSLAVSPASFCPVPVYCFVQPDNTAEDILPQYRKRTVVSLWRKSQFTPDVIAPRGPPS